MNTLLLKEIMFSLDDLKIVILIWLLLENIQSS